ncbi:MAG: hypothetical protein AAGD23_12490 [Pseudomonadota bacterium]
MRRNLEFLVLAVATLVAFVAVQSTSARAEDAGALPAVGGTNGKLSVEGGVYDDDGAFLALGTVSIPAGYAWGLQFDGAAGTIDGEEIIGGGFHAFTRDPDSHLIGLYASHHQWNDFQISRIAAESELYWNELTFRALLGYEHIRFPARISTMVLTDREDGHVFGKADLVWYPFEDLEIFAGFHYESEEPLGAIGLEYLMTSADTSHPIAFFAMGHFGDDDYLRATAGLRIYFGDGGRSLKRIRRELDPPNHTPVSPHFTEMVFVRRNNLPEPE